jgi:hypothetical protein
MQERLSAYLLGFASRGLEDTSTSTAFLSQVGTKLEQRQLRAKLSVSSYKLETSCRAHGNTTWIKQLRRYRVRAFGIPSFSQKC